MDPELFRKRLEEFAEIKQMKTPRSPGIRENDEPEIIFRGGEEFPVELNNNPTIGWGIKKLKPHVAVCEDCCEVVENRVTEIKLHQMPEAHWRKNCKNCMKTQNPYTGKFDLLSTKVFHVVSCWMKGMPEPESYNVEKDSDLRPVFKKPTK